MGASGWTHLDVEKIVRVSAKAMLLRLKDDLEVWVPLSQISDPEDYEEGDENCTVSVKEWLGQKILSGEV